MNTSPGPPPATARPVPTWTCSSSVLGSRASTSSTGRSKKATRPCSSRPAGESAAPGTGTATREPASTRRATPTVTSSRRISSKTGVGRSTSRPSPRPSATSTTWWTGSTCARTSDSTPGSARPSTRSRPAPGGSWPAGEPICRPASSSPPPESSPFLTRPRSPGARTSPVRRTTPASGRPGRSTSGASGWRSSGPPRAASRSYPPSPIRSNR